MEFRDIEKMVLGYRGDILGIVRYAKARIRYRGYVRGITRLSIRDGEIQSRDIQGEFYSEFYTAIYLG